MKKQFILIHIFSFLFLSSCCSWNESSKKSYLTECEESKFDKEFCECSLEKLITNFECYDDAIKQEEKFAEIFIECN
ncbi:MAG: hypothetical protein CL846_04785 [Crocinitomicaceae bacterium]|nr:hypothetical protein [Crocinitomicaceae bacterium]|tara:strand:+ start:1002 stop:1232 length:231 start_codon:yes stop_codon:yes gene_type:complete